MAKCSSCGKRMGIWEGDANFRCSSCATKDNPPEATQQKAGSGEVDHGIFTGISYVTAWLTAVFGSLFGLAMIVTGLSSDGDVYTAGVGVMIIIGSWVGASGIGVLAEISRKLTHSEQHAREHFKHEE